MIDKRAPQVPQDKGRLVCQGLEVHLDVLHQRSKGLPLMIVRHLTSRPAPEPLDPIGVRVIGGRVNEPQVVLQLGQHLAHQARACRGMGTQVINNDDRPPSAGARAGDCGAHLRAEDIGSATGGQAALEPAVTPVDKPKAIDLVIGTGGLDQALATAALAAPDARQRRMERELDLVLEIDIGVRQQAQQLVNVGRHVLQQLRFDKRGHGWRGRRTGPGQDHLHPQAFPT
jgi:hypothetical protein